ncbi:MAG: glycosyltransferase family 2 protein [Labrys sp. (in: a-proteobacteria)]|jgi:dolichol-phosphate mannosyltransferase
MRLDGIDTPDMSGASAARRSRLPAPELTLVVPTFNEVRNIPVLIDRVQRVLVGIDWEIIVVDDNSPDGTAAVVRDIGQRDGRIRCLRRIGRRGLSGALLEGMLVSQSRYVASIDADLQHDEAILTTMLERLRRGDVDLVVASRYAPGGDAAAFSAGRARASQWSSVLARTLTGVTLTDPMSGFFMLRRDIVERLAPSLSAQGFKLLLDIVITAGGSLRTAEVPYVFRNRLHGESKLDVRIALEFFGLIIAKLTNDVITVRFLLFCLVGTTGVAIHMLVLAVMLSTGVTSFTVNQAIATVTAITWNFVLNNRLTYRDQRLTGWRAVHGLLRFQFVCAVGALSDVGAASWIYDFGSKWWVAGLGGAAMGAVWNYVVSTAFVWRRS